MGLYHLSVYYIAVVSVLHSAERMQKPLMSGIPLLGSVLQQHSECFTVPPFKWIDSVALALEGNFQFQSIPDKSFKAKQRRCSVSQTRGRHTFSLQSPYFQLQEEAVYAPDNMWSNIK